MKLKTEQEESLAYALRLQPTMQFVSWVKFYQVLLDAGSNSPIDSLIDQSIDPPVHHLRAHQPVCLS